MGSFAWADFCPFHVGGPLGIHDFGYISNKVDMTPYGYTDGNPYGFDPAQTREWMTVQHGVMNNDDMLYVGQIRHNLDGTCTYGSGGWIPVWYGRTSNFARYGSMPLDQEHFWLGWDTIAHDGPYLPENTGYMPIVKEKMMSSLGVNWGNDTWWRIENLSGADEGAWTFGYIPVWCTADAYQYNFGSWQSRIGSPTSPWPTPARPLPL